MNNWISQEAIAEIGMFRKQNKCAWCKKKMDLSQYNIQLCISCRNYYFKKLAGGHGIDCGCAECKKIKNMLQDKEESGEIHLAGTKEDLKKIRGDHGKS